MAVVTDTVLKTYFQTGDFPTQSNFEDLIDSLFFGTIQKITHTTTGAETKTTSISISGCIATVVIVVAKNTSGSRTYGSCNFFAKAGVNEANQSAEANDLLGTGAFTATYTGLTAINLNHVGTVGETISWTTRVIYLKP